MQISGHFQVPGCCKVEWALSGGPPSSWDCPQRAAGQCLSLTLLETGTPGLQVYTLQPSERMSKGMSLLLGPGCSR